MVKPRGWGRDEDGRMSRQTDTQMHGEEKSKWALARATCRSHLSGAHLIYRPDPRPSQSRSVRQRQAVRTWGRGAVHVARRMGGGLGLQLPPLPPAGRVQGCACPLLRAKGIHTLRDALCVCAHVCVFSPEVSADWPQLLTHLARVPPMGQDTWGPHTRTPCCPATTADTLGWGTAPRHPFSPHRSPGDGEAEAGWPRSRRAGLAHRHRT